MTAMKGRSDSHSLILIDMFKCLPEISASSTFPVYDQLVKTTLQLEGRLMDANPRFSLTEIVDERMSDMKYV